MDCTICANEVSRRAAFAASACAGACAGAAACPAHGPHPSPFNSPETGLDRPWTWSVAGPRVSARHRGWPDTQSPAGRTRPRARRSLARLALRHGRRSGDAARALAPVDGSDPPLRDARIGIGKDRHGTGHAALPGGSLPVHQSRAGRPTARRSDGRFRQSAGAAKGNTVSCSERDVTHLEERQGAIGGLPEVEDEARAVARPHIGLAPTVGEGVYYLTRCPRFDLRGLEHRTRQQRLPRRDARIPRLRMNRPVEGRDSGSGAKPKRRGRRSAEANGPPARVRPEGLSAESSRDEAARRSGSGGDGESVVQRLEAALDGPSRQGLLVRERPGEGGRRGVNLHLVPSPYRAFGEAGRSRHGPSRWCATGDPAAEPQDLAALLDEQEVRRAPPLA